MPRYRNVRLYVNVTAEEKRAIEEKMKIMRMSNMGEFVRLALTTTQPVNIDTSGFLALSYEINHLGVNLNQIAKKVNTTNAVYENDIRECKEIFAKAEKALLSFYDLIDEVDKLRQGSK